MNAVRTVGLQRMSTHNGPGIRSTLFVKGCPLRCIWCHNPESQAIAPQIAFIEKKCSFCRKCGDVCPLHAHIFDANGHRVNWNACDGCGLCATVCRNDALILYGREMTVPEVMEVFLKDQIYYEASNGGITISGGEPTMHLDFVLELLKCCKEKHLSTAIDTCGYAPTESFEKLLPLTDYFLYDIKHIAPEEHRKYTGVSNELIVSNLHYLDQQGANIEIRIPCIPGVNTADDVIDRIGALLAPLRHLSGVRILPYNNFCGSKYRNLGMKNSIPQVPPPTTAEMNLIKSRLEKFDLEVLYG